MSSERICNGAERWQGAATYRGAEPTLRAVRPRDAVLDRVEALAAGPDTLDSHHMTRVDGAERRQAGVDRAVDVLLQLAVVVRNHHRAGAAAALAAAELGAGQTCGTNKEPNKEHP